MRRTLLLSALAALLCATAPAGGAAAEAVEGSCRPLIDGGMVFSAIEGPEDPESYCYEVTVGEEQELEQVDEQHVGVFYNSGYLAFEISAVPASDAVGSTVPTTLTLTGRNTVTLTVHHRAGNPAAGGAPFVYPVVAGPGWEGGFRTIVVPMSPFAAPADPAAAQPQPPVAQQCVVPRLRGESLWAARRALHRSHCRLGPVHGTRSKGATVVEQYRRSARLLPAWTEVGVRLAT